MKEILGGQLDIAFVDLKINAKKTYEGNTFLDDKTQVWELSNEDFEKLCKIDEGDWKENWGWWRSAEGSNMHSPISRFNINHHYMKAWDGYSRIEVLEEVHGNTNHPDYCFDKRKYHDLLQYFSEEIRAGQPRNVCALAVDLARINGITMGELFTKYQG